MKSRKQIIINLIFLILAVFIFSLPGTGQSTQPNMITLGKARFTVITPNLVRLEYSENGKFIDSPSIFAINRSRTGARFTINKQQDTTIIDTGFIRLSYKNDGQPFNPDNLQAVIRKDNETITWTPGMKNTSNLGGTVRTLDGWSGPGDLGEGILSRDGWYLLDDSRGHLLVNNWVQSRPANAGTDWYLFGYGTNYRGAFEALTTVSGPVPMPRKYALGAWYSRYWPYSSDDYRQIVKEYAEHDFPLDIMVLDMDWHKEGWTGWSLNRELLPDFEDLLEWFHQQGLFVTLNVHPADGIQPHEDMYEAFMRDMGKDPAVDEPLPFDAGDKKYLDTLFKHTHLPLEAAGVDFWWLDWQQYPFTRSIPDLTNLAWLNYYYYKHTSRDDNRGISFSRWAGWGDHRHPIHFSGDASTDWKMLAFEVPFTSTAGNVGCFFWSHDIGGHAGSRNDESYTRWCQFGAVTAALRSHSTRDQSLDRRPWTYPKWAEDSMRASFHLRSELFPYIYTSVYQSCSESVPLNRPMYIDYPKDEEAYINPQQFMFGDNLLAAPITSPGIGPNRVATQVVWFPKDIWYNFFTGERYDGPTTILAASDINEFPLFARGGVPIPMQPYTDRMTTTPIDTLVIRCYPGEDRKTGVSTLYEDDGITTGYTKGEFATTELTYSRNGDEITITVSPAKGSYKGQVTRRACIIELPCTTEALSVTVDGKTVQSEYDPITQTNRIHIPARPVNQSRKIVVKAGLADNEKLRVQAIARRAGIPESAESKSVAEMFSAAGKLDSESTNLLLTSAGIGISARNESAYGYPSNEISYLFCPAGLIDKEQVSWKLEERCGDKSRTIELPPTDSSGSPIVAIPASTTKSEPLDKTSTCAVRADILLSGQPFSIYGPWQRWNLAGIENNLAQKAKVSVSSLQGGTISDGAVDGVISGYPASHSYEWASNKEQAGAWIRLDWDEEVTIDRIWLFDRPNLDDHILSGEITFSDGTTLKVGELANDASDGVELSFPAKKVRWLKFTATEVGEKNMNTGLSEIAVFKAR